MNPRGKQAAALPVFLALSFGLPGLGAYLAGAGAGAWYAGLDKPPLTPPNWLFGPVWTVLYLFMGAAGWKVWCNAQGGALIVCMTAFGVQLFLNALWAPLFFGTQVLGFALIGAAALWLAVWAAAALFFRISKTAGVLFALYGLWATYALYLSAALWWMN